MKEQGGWVMTRPLRLVFSGALYHVLSRGNRHELIYITTMAISLRFLRC